MHELYDIVVEIAHDLMSKSVNLNLEDAGWEEALAGADYDVLLARSWYTQNIEDCGLWTPSLRSLLFNGGQEDPVSVLTNKRDAFEVQPRRR